jgi:hypothetical protein
VCFMGCSPHSGRVELCSSCLVASSFETRMFYVDATTFTAMKSTRRPTSQAEEEIPDFSRRPHRLHLEQVVEVTGFSKLKLRPIRLDDESRMVEFTVAFTPRAFAYGTLDTWDLIGGPPMNVLFGFAPIQPRFTPSSSSNQPTPATACNSWPLDD